MNYNDPRVEKMKNMSLSEIFDSVFDSRKKEREEAIRRCAELEEEVRKLRAVAEKANALIGGCKPVDCKPLWKEKGFDCVTQCRWFALKDALAALNGGEKPQTVIVEEDNGYPD